MKIRRKSDGSILDVSPKAYALIYSKSSDFDKITDNDVGEKAHSEAKTSKAAAARKKATAAANPTVVPTSVSEGGGNDDMPTESEAIPTA